MLFRSINLNKYLSLNTVMYGTLHFLKTNNQGGNKIFTVEDLIMYRGYDLRTQTEQYRLSCILTLLNNDLPENNEEKSNIKLSPCHISLSYDELLQNYYEGHYSYIAYSVQTRNTLKPYVYNRKYDTQIISPETHPTSASVTSNETMRVTADLKRDVYHLHQGEKYIGVADIPDYKTSVMMNRLFRYIKENDNLDALEESDDEEEFQDISEDKFLQKNANYDMVCKFNHKTKRYIPLRTVE